MNALQATLASIFSIAAVTAATFAHDDDGKVRDRQKPVFGKVYREGQGGVAGGGFASNGVQLKAQFPLNTIDLNATSGNDCWGYTSPSGREYALIGVSSGTGVFEVTNPVNTTKIGFITGPTSLWRDIKVFGTYAYAVSEGGGGIQVINMANVDLGQVSLAGSVTTGGGLATHNVAINTQSGYLYRCGGGSSGLRFYDLNANPASPTFVGEWSAYYVHDAQIVSYTSGPYAGREIAFCCGGLNGGNASTGLYIVDVTNKAAPVLLSSLLYPNARYSHQGWLTEDRRYFLLGDELDEGATQALTTTYVIDVQNLNTPTLLGQFGNQTAAITHNCYTHQGKMFAANYRSGMRVFDLRTPGTLSSISEIAYFDTYPTDDAAQFNGLWNVYPYFASGTIIGSDLERGLFVWRLGGPVATFSVVNAPSIVSPAGGTTVDVSIAAGANQTLDPATAILVVSSTGGTTNVPLSPLGGGVYRGVFPPSTCTSTVSYSFEVRNTAGDPSTDTTRTALSAYGASTVADSNFETADGWVGGVAGDTAVSGQWVRVAPIGTLAQPGADHSAVGTMCWVTGQGVVGGADGAADVDGGITTLLSPVFNLSGMDEPLIEYWYWYSNNLGGAPNADSMPIQISNDGGTTWVNLIDLAASNNAWSRHQWRVRDFVTPTANVRVRFVARDLATGSLVEAAIDDFKITNTDCTPNVVGDLNGDGLVNGGDLATLLNGWGSAGATDLDGNGTTDAADLAIILNNWS